MTPLTAQQIFTRVAKHLLTQGKQCRNAAGCLYQSRGKMCAIGRLIPKGIRVRGFNNCSLQDIPDEVLASMRLPVGDINCGTGVVYRLLHDLQVLHDTVEPADWRRDLKALAGHFSLTMPRVKATVAT